MKRILKKLVYCLLVQETGRLLPTRVLTVYQQAQFTRVLSFSVAVDE
jgi:hypothetical protein